MKDKKRIGLILKFLLFTIGLGGLTILLFVSSEIKTPTFEQSILVAFGIFILMIIYIASGTAVLKELLY